MRLSIDPFPLPPLLRSYPCPTRRKPPTTTTAPSNPLNAPTPMSPISYVPVELLMQIITHIPRLEFDESLLAVQTARHDPTPPTPTWMSIAQVCRRWRAIAADCKDFWSYIPFQASAYWVELSLARSYPLPISFLLDFSSPQPEWYQQSALSALRMLSRAREVHLWGSATANSQFRREALRLLDMSSAPVLEVFSVQGHTPRDSVTLSDDIFLCRDFAALHSLTLAYCDIEPSSPLFRAPLVSLHLVNCRVEFPRDLPGFLPQLRTLVLENTYGCLFGNIRGVFHLPHLQNLELTNVSFVIAFILRCILIPSSSSLSITCTDFQDIDEPLDDLSILHKVTSSLSPVLSTYLDRAHEEGYIFPLLEIVSPMNVAKKTLMLLDPASDAGSPRLRVSLIWVGTPKSTDLFSQMISALPTIARQRIHTLRMRDTLLCSADARSRLLPFAALHDKARDEAVRGLLAIVKRRDFLPALRQVSFEGMDLKKIDLDMLARVLVHRQRSVIFREGKISLSLENCLTTVGLIRGLRDYLGPHAVDVAVVANVG
ncbi:hypothetical protein BC827DRAFT_965197 [Russula dissimulans]|nr:hypothetical protein BC827DRAFT_965197 [Russula dissimulans]